jgi:hypothetical protein
MGKQDRVDTHPSFGQGSTDRGNTLQRNDGIARRGTDETAPADHRLYPTTIMSPDKRGAPNK